MESPAAAPSNSDAKVEVVNDKTETASADSNNPYHEYIVYATPHRPAVCMPPPPCCYKHQLGNMYICCDRDKIIDKKTTKEILCVYGPCWPMVILTSSLFWGVPTLMLIILSQIDIIDKLTIYILAPIIAVFVIGTLTCYFATACGNPGIKKYVKQAPETPSITSQVSDFGRDRWYFDERFNTWRTNRWNYDVETQLMIEDIDHFCPWTGTVIAKGNIKQFYWFNGCCWVLCAVTIIAPVLTLIFSSGF